MAVLSPQEIARYRGSGFVVPAYRLPAARVAALRATVDRLIAENPDIRPERLVSAHIAGTNSEGVRGSRDFLDLARDPGILDLVGELIGPDIILWGCQIFCKPGGDGMEVPWHQDGHYWPIRPLATCTVWVALDPSTVENGCLRVIPGSHCGKRLYEHMREDRADIVLNQAVKPGEFDAESALDIELAPGQMSMHDVHLIHGSNANRSPRRRAGVAIRYMPASSFFDRGLMATSAQSGYTVDFATRPIWLLRGVDRSGRNDFRTGHRPASAVG
jgi:ectoine hydroxylase-related dioxygenase (phytanoyl-CoA dioxygenase family)